MTSKFFKYLFYRFHLNFEKGYGESSSPQFTALCAVGLLLGLNTLTVVTLLTIFLHLANPHQLLLPCLFLMPSIILYFSFVRNRKYENFLIEFANETRDVRTRRNKQIVIYILFSAILPFVLAFVIGLMR
jgi:hypothetical protein